MDTDNTSHPSDNGRQSSVVSLQPMEDDFPELHAIETAWREVQRRDTSMEREKWHWKLMAGGLLGLLLLLTPVTAYLFFRRAQVEPFVQQVQVDEAGKVIPLGVPVKLLNYTPEQGYWLEMIGEWIQRVRWRGVDTIQAREDWKWAYVHTCGLARQLLQRYEKIEKPFNLGTRMRAVELQSITKNPAPLSYQAIWEETTTEMHTEPKTQRWAGTFTVGRIKPPNQDAVLLNRLGLCVIAFDITMQP